MLFFGARRVVSSESLSLDVYSRKTSVCVKAGK
jgi:hypothetical protein